MYLINLGNALFSAVVTYILLIITVVCFTYLHRTHSLDNLCIDLPRTHSLGSSCIYLHRTHSLDNSCTLFPEVTRFSLFLVPPWQPPRTTTPTSLNILLSGTWEWESPACFTSSQRRSLWLTVLTQLVLNLVQE